MGRFSKPRGVLAALLMVALAGSSWLLTHEALRSLGGGSHRDAIFNPGYQHAKRLQIAAARAAMDVLGMTAHNAADYQADYRVQRIQIQADSIGLNRWAAHDARRQPLLREIRASLANFIAALDRASSTDATAATPELLPSLKRTETALSNYAASLTEPMRQSGTSSHHAGYLFAEPVVLWWLLLLILVELAFLAWVVFSPSGGWKSTI